jgi:hypothetical protein
MVMFADKLVLNNLLVIRTPFFQRKTLLINFVEETEARCN